MQLAAHTMAERKEPVKERSPLFLRSGDVSSNGGPTGINIEMEQRHSPCCDSQHDHSDSNDIDTQTSFYLKTIQKNIYLFTRQNFQSNFPRLKICFKNWCFLVAKIFEQGRSYGGLRQVMIRARLRGKDLNHVQGAPY